MFRLKTIVLTILISIVAAINGQAAELTTLKNAVNGVTITVTPQLRAGESPSFKVVLDTHSQDLRDDLLNSSVLVDSAGNRYAPTAWDGPAPGGHHREGILRFPPLSSTVIATT